MLLKCPECELPISDKALTCPHCGYPLISQAKKNKPCKSRRMRLPNGFGRITEIKSKNLRKPFRVMVTVGHDENGRPIGKLLQPQAYFETYNDAYAALVEYNKDPYELESELTVGELYVKWFEEYRKGLKAKSSERTISSAWAYCKEVANIRVRDLRARHIKGVLDEGFVITSDGERRYASPSTKGRIKSMFNIMLDYAVEFELVDKNYARTFVLSEEVINMKKQAAKGHITFSDEEMKTLWENISFPYVNVLLVQCYMGWRPQELGLIRLENVDLNDWTIVGGMKTEAGSNRLVPIHTRIRPIIQSLYDEAVSLNSEYLINCTDTHTHRSSLFFTYDKYQKRFNKIKYNLKLNQEHRPHDARKYFVTQCKKAGVDEYAIKYMVGHTISDITEKVYTERAKDIIWLHNEISKVY